MKSERRAAILDIIEREAITSQEQLREKLHRLGIEATQATLSRDIGELALVKRAADGAYRRADAADMQVSGDATALLADAVDEYLRRLERVEQLLVLKTDVGTAQPLALAIDRARLSEVAGTIAGDDTILVVCRGADAAKALAKRLEKMRT